MVVSLCSRKFKVACHVQRLGQIQFCCRLHPLIIRFSVFRHQAFIAELCNPEPIQRHTIYRHPHQNPLSCVPSINLSTS
jgi:hypothetical protein